MRDDRIEVTPEQEAEFLILHGSIMIWTARDGRRFRVLEPWEDGRQPTEPKDA